MNTVQHTHTMSYETYGTPVDQGGPIVSKPSTLSERDQIALVAFGALIGKSPYEQRDPEYSQRKREGIARGAFDYADAFLAAR